MADWVIQEPRAGSIVLWCDRRRIADYPTVPEAERAASRQMDKDDSLIHEEPDGYRYRLKVPRRRGWRAPH